MDRLALRRVQHPQATNNFRVILKTEHDGEVGIGSIGLKAFTGNNAAWTWSIDTVMPLRDYQSQGRGADRKACMVAFRTAWENHCRQPGWREEFLAIKRR
jgi:hypothetical protein